MGEMPFDIARCAVENVVRDFGMNGEHVPGVEYAPSACLQGKTPRGHSPKTGLCEIIPSTMGEPLLYTHFRELLELCKSLNVPVNLTTNGSFPGMWGCEENMRLLLDSCSDIKVSCMGWRDSFAEMMPGLEFGAWKSNVERLVGMRREVRGRCATVSLQVTLHSRTAGYALEILRWAETLGIDRIKWNLPVFLSVASAELRNRYELQDNEAQYLRGVLVSTTVCCEGSLFWGRNRKETPKRFADEDARKERYDVGCKVRLDADYNACCNDDNNAEKKAAGCPFVNELWILPDGSTQNCPNPERRFGDAQSIFAKCENCTMSE